MKRILIIFCVIASVAIRVEAQECSGGRMLTDEENVYGGANDLNGDGVSDLRDMVRGLQFLFGGGEPPCPPILDQAPTVITLREQIDELEETLDQAQRGCDELPLEPAARFASQFYGPLDLRRAARDQWGPLATLTAVGDHLHDWRARIGRQLLPLDLKRAVAQQYGRGWTLVAVGVHRFDWKAFRFSEPDHVVLPVMVVASDRFFDIDRVRLGLNRFRSVLGRVQGWYSARVDGVLGMLQPLVIHSSLTSAQWNDLSNLTQQDEHRFDLLHEAIVQYREHLPEPGGNLRVVLAPYSGESADVWLGAASHGPYVVVPPRATSLDCPASGPLDTRCADAAYAVGHELGHTFGLGHSCDDYPHHPQCANSIMQVGRPPEAILLQREICTLLQSPFFHEIGVIVQPQLDGIADGPHEPDVALVAGRRIP